MKKVNSLQSYKKKFGKNKIIVRGKKRLIKVWASNKIIKVCQ